MSTRRGSRRSRARRASVLGALAVCGLAGCGALLDVPAEDELRFLDAGADVADGRPLDDATLTEGGGPDDGGRRLDAGGDASASLADADASSTGGDADADAAGTNAALILWMQAQFALLDAGDLVHVWPNLAPPVPGVPDAAVALYSTAVGGWLGPRARTDDAGAYLSFTGSVYLVFPDDASIAEPAFTLLVVGRRRDPTAPAYLFGLDNPGTASLSVTDDAGLSLRLPSGAVVACPAWSASAFTEHTFTVTSAGQGVPRVWVDGNAVNCAAAEAGAVIEGFMGLGAEGYAPNNHADIREVRVYRGVVDDAGGLLPSK